MDQELTGVAIVGMAGRFPGARNVAELWEKLLRGEELISRFSREELAAAGVPDALADDPRYVPAGAVLADADLFDARLFGFTPREAALLDPQQRQFLEVAWEALEDAGCDPGRFAGAIGVFAGESMPRYLMHNLMPAGELERAETQAVIGNDKDFLATRLSYKLDLKGPSLDVQTACSTSLVATVLACQSLLNFQCDLALAGGVSVRNPQTTGYLYEENGILSPDGHCRPFDARAQGTVPGSGVGVVALKRLEDALADGDAIYAIIRGAAINNDGAAKAGFTAPSVSGQEEVLRTAHAIAGVEPREIGFVEGHGTATPLGDPIEFRALSRVFGEATDERGFCALGSIKSNFGHTDAAAGVAGLIKATLALSNRAIPPTLHFASPNPEIDLAASPFYVNASAVPWEGDGRPRRAGVSSFGIGGTNAHVVLEEAPATELPAAADDDDPAAELLLLSANEPAALDEASRRLAGALAGRGGEPAPDLASVARTLRLGRRSLPHRRAIVARGADEARQILATLDAERMATAQVPKGDPAVAFLLPGQGIEFVGVSAPLYRREPVYREALDACAEGLVAYLGLDLRQLLHPRPGEEEEANRRLASTVLVQPAVFSISWSIARLWISWGIEPKALLGHSLGEYAAAALAGVLTLPDALRLVAARGRLTATLPPGAMMSVALDEAGLASLMPPEVSVAVANAPDRSVVTGPREALAALAADLEGRGIETRPLPIDHAFHSPAVAPVLDAWRAEVARTPLSRPQLPYLSNVSGTWIRPDEVIDPEYWVTHLRQPVRFASAVGELLADPARILLEVGPGQTLTSFVRRHPDAQRARLIVASLPPRESTEPSDEGILRSLGRLWLAGVAFDAAALHPERGRTVHLPTYPFARERHWIDRPATAPQTAAGERPGDAAGWTVPLWQEELPPRRAAGAHRAEGARWLVWTDRGGLGAQLIKRLRDLRVEAIGAAPGPAFARAGESAYTLAPDDPEGFRRLLAAAMEGDDQPLRLVYLWSLDDGESGAPGLASLAQSLASLSAPAAGRIALDLGLAGTAPWNAAAPPETAALLAHAARLAAAFPCRTVDLEPTTPDSPELPRLTERLLAELAAPPAGERVAWRGRRRFVERLAPLPEAATAVTGTGGGALLLAGDDGELGMDLAERLAGGAGPRVLWVGPAGSPRSPLDLAPAEAAMARFEEDLAKRIRRKPPEEIAALDELAVRWIVEALAGAGIAVAPGAETTVDEVRRQFRLLPRFERFLQFFVHTLAWSGVVERGDGERLRFTGQAAGAGSAAELTRRITAERPHLAGLTTLLAHCVTGYAPAFAGEVEALSILFPGGSPERLHQALLDAEGGTEEPAFPLLTEVVRDLLARWPGGPLRILEVGAGQGVLTRELLPLFAGHDVEYHFTDIARTFVLAAERQAKERGWTGLRFGVLDIGRDPAAQGFHAGAFHLVLAANVIHAASRIAPAVGHLAQLLAPGGLLALIENVHPRPWADMIWGLSDGWWHFEDTDLRSTSPLLSAERWQEVFRATGLERPGAWPRHPALAGTNDAALLLAAKPVDAGGANALPMVDADSGDAAAFRAALAETASRLAPLRGAVWVGAPAATDLLADLPSELPLAWVSGAAADLPAHAARAEARGRAWALAGDDPEALAAALATAFAGAEWPPTTAWRKPEREAPRAAMAEPEPEAAPRGANRPTLSTAFVAPRDETEEAIAALWSRALGIEPIGAFDNFLDLGGDSLIGLQVARALGERFDFGGRRFSLFENPTVAAVARFLAAGEPAAVPEDDDGFAERAARGARRREMQRGRRSGG